MLRFKGEQSAGSCTCVHENCGALEWACAARGLNMLSGRSIFLEFLGVVPRAVLGVVCMYVPVCRVCVVLVLVACACLFVHA